MKTVLCSALALVALGVTPAGAATVTFDNSFFNLDAPGETADVEGGRIIFVSGNANGFAIPTFFAGSVNNGTPNLFAANRVTIGFSEASPSPSGFTLQTFDLGGTFVSSPDRWASSLTVTGTYLLGGTISSTFNLPGTPTLATQVLGSGFANLASVSFAPNVGASGNSSDYEYSLDNIVFSPSALAAVPEPATWAMMILGFGFVGAAVRKRAKANVSYA